MVGLIGVTSCKMIITHNVLWCLCSMLNGIVRTVSVIEILSFIWKFHYVGCPWRLEFTGLFIRCNEYQRISFNFIFFGYRISFNILPWENTDYLHIESYIFSLFQRSQINFLIFPFVKIFFMKLGTEWMNPVGWAHVKMS